MQDEFEKYMIEQREAFELNDLPVGHQARFEEKLASLQKTRKPNYFYRIMIAATVAVLIGLSAILALKEDVKPVEVVAEAFALKDVSPEMEEVEFYLTSSVSEKMSFVKSNFSQESEHVDNCMKMVKQLEENYENLKKELAKNPGEEMIINAMVMNYQTRVDVLEMLIEQLKTNPEEYSLTKLKENEEIVL